MAAAALCFFITVLFIIVAVISKPVHPVALEEQSAQLIPNLEKQWVVLSGADYTVGECIGKKGTIDSTLFTPKTYFYYNIKVQNDFGEEYWLAARVNSEKNASLSQGVSIITQGNLLPLESEYCNRQLKSLEKETIPVYSYYICDNGASSSSGASNRLIGVAVAIVSFLLGVLSLVFLR